MVRLDQRTGRKPAEEVQKQRAGAKCQKHGRGQVTYVALRIVNSVSCVKRIQHEIHFSWQAQYFVRFEDGTGCSAHCK